MAGQVVFSFYNTPPVVPPFFKCAAVCNTFSLRIQFSADLFENYAMSCSSRSANKCETRSAYYFENTKDGGEPLLEIRKCASE